MFEHIVSFQARYRPEAVAISTPVGSASFAELEADVNRMARRLAGVAPRGGAGDLGAAPPSRPARLRLTCMA